MTIVRLCPYGRLVINTFVDEAISVYILSTDEHPKKYKEIRYWKESRKLKTKRRSKFAVLRKMRLTNTDKKVD
jgi:hypothetical protein